MTTAGNMLMIVTFVVCVTGWVAYNWYLMGKSKQSK